MVDPSHYFYLREPHPFRKEHPSALPTPLQLITCDPCHLRVPHVSSSSDQINLSIWNLLPTHSPAV